MEKQSHPTGIKAHSPGKRKKKKGVNCSRAKSERVRGQQIHKFTALLKDLP